MIDTDKVISLLGSGLKAEAVASAVGCTPAYISQLLGDETIASKVAELRTVDVFKHKKLDDKYDDLEAKLLARLENIIEHFHRPRDILAALQMVNNAKRKSPGNINPATEAGTVVTLVMPNIIMNNYKVNVHGSMVEVGGRSLAPLNSSVLMKTLEERIGSNEKQKLLGATPAKDIPNERIVSSSSV